MNGVEWNGELKGGKKFKEDQKRVLQDYFNGSRRVAVSAGAGTGKTTLLVEIISETVARYLKEDSERNPFEDILAVSFNVEAARQIKTKVKKRLKEHYEKTGNLEIMKDITRWLENESWIKTLDSLTRNLLSEVMFDADLNIISDVPDEYQLEQIKEDIIVELRNNPSLEDDIQLLSDAFPNEEWRGERGWIGLLENSFDNSRKYCIDSKEFCERLKSTFEQELYQGYKPPFSPSEIDEIFQNIRGEGRNIDPQRVNESYNYNLEIIESFENVFREYENLYDEKTKEKGLLSHNDARYWLVKYAQGAEDINSKYQDSWEKTQRDRFEHVLIDEFQDTSYAQCSLIRNFIGQNTNIFLIGDPKQTIYQWRAAEPQIFIDILNYIPNNGKSGEIPYLEASNFTKKELVSNFRSHNYLIDMYNDIFGENNNSIFEDDFYTGDINLPHSDLNFETQMPEEDISEEKIHLYEGDCWDRIPRILNGIKNGDIDIKVRKGDNPPKWEKAELGDCCILLQSRGRWSDLRNRLIEENINYVMIGEKGLFDRPEIKLIINVLDWFKNPHNKDPLIRILRSPVVGMSDRALRYLSYHDYDIRKAINSNEMPQWFEDEGDIKLIKGLLNLRDDLRWLREGRKTEMVEEIIKHSHMDSVILTSSEGDQNLANIWTLLDIITSWEEEELLDYDELLERLKFFKESDEDNYNLAVLNDDYDRNSVKIATVHSVKGLEFPIVFTFYPKLSHVHQWSYFNQNRELFVKNSEENIAGHITLAQKGPENYNENEWEDHFCTEGKLADPCQRSDSLFYDSFNREWFNEKWRLYYVALTRAKDHLFHNCTSARDRFSWQRVFNNWLSNIDIDNRDDIEHLGNLDNITENLVKDKPKDEDFNIDDFEKINNRNKLFKPKVVNPSHIYDLISCPRRYQYSVLQNVQGGDSCIYPIDDPEAEKFGTRVHRAMELRDFSEEEANEEYKEYIEQLDNKSRNKVETAVENFLDSRFFNKNDLKNRELLKEKNILYELENENGSNVILNNQIDLIFKGDQGISIVDYKTRYPNSNDVGSKYVKNHIHAQLKAYGLAIEEGLGTSVENLYCVYFNSKSEEWSVKNVGFNKNEIKNKIIESTKIEIKDGELIKKEPIPGFCHRDYCEFYDLCKKNQS